MRKQYSPTLKSKVVLEARDPCPPRLWSWCGGPTGQGDLRWSSPHRREWSPQRERAIVARGEAGVAAEEPAKGAEALEAHGEADVGDALVGAARHATRTRQR